MRPILCVVDLTESAAQVLEVAARMAYAYKSHLTILFPYRLIDNEYRGEISNLKGKLEQQARDKFLLLKKQVPVLDQVLHDFQPEIGFAADRISYFIKWNKVTSVVISQRQANLMNEVNQVPFQNLITNSKLPFVIVPEEVDVDVFWH
ncbi:MAG TPA: universal stress protein [Chryseolinea sp.]|nr:universal stress protein [Chryseolinea sp.]